MTKYFIAETLIFFYKNNKDFLNSID